MWEIWSRPWSSVGGRSSGCNEARPTADHADLPVRVMHQPVTRRHSITQFSTLVGPPFSHSSTWWISHQASGSSATSMQARLQAAGPLTSSPVRRRGCATPRSLLGPVTGCSSGCSQRSGLIEAARPCEVATLSTDTAGAAMAVPVVQVLGKQFCDCRWLIDEERREFVHGHVVHGAWTRLFVALCVVPGTAFRTVSRMETGRRGDVGGVVRTDRGRWRWRQESWQARCDPRRSADSAVSAVRPTR